MACCMTCEASSPRVGIILCANKDASVVRFSVLYGNEQLFASRYRLILPIEEELRQEHFREQRLIEERTDNAAKP